MPLPPDRRRRRPRPARSRLPLLLLALIPAGLAAAAWARLKREEPDLAAATLARLQPAGE